MIVTRIIFVLACVVSTSWTQTWPPLPPSTTGSSYGYGPNCYEVPFSAAVNATYRPGCDYSGVDWDHLNGSEIIKQIYTYTHDCIDALKDNFDKLNSSCLSNYTQTAEELKTLSPADLDKYAAKKEADFEREQCSCSYDPNGYGSYYGYGYGNGSGYGYGYGYGPNCYEVPFSAAVNATYRPGCDYSGVDWDHLNGSEIIKQIYTYTHDCIDALKDNFDKLNSSCLSNYTQTAEELKTLSPADLDKYAAKKEADFEREQCSCSYDPYGYGSYYGYGYGNGSGYGYGYGYGLNCYEVPFSAAVNATYRPGCDYSGVDWDHLNGSEIIKQIYTYTHDCIDALKDNFDKLNSSCLSNYTQTAEELKTLSPADLDKYAAKKEADFEREQCSCSYDPYGYGSYYGYGYGNGSGYGYGYGYGPNCYEVPFSAAVNATYRPGCDYSGVDWDHLNGSEIIKQIYTYTHDCIDALKDNFDKLNSSCLSNYTQTAEELKTLSPADLDKYAAKKEADFEREQCSCSYDQYGYGSYYGYGYGNGSYYGYGYGNGSGYGYGYGYGPNCYEVPFSAAVNATYRPGCDYSGVDWDHLNGSEIIKQIYTYTHDCIDALKDNFDKLNSSCLSNYTQTAEELKTLSPADLDKYAAKKEADFEREQCSCSYDPYGYGSYYGYGYGNGSGYGYGYGYGPNCYEVPFSAAVNATYRPGCDYSGVDWDHLNGSEIIKQIYTYTHDCIDALKDNFDKLNSSCLSNYTQTAEELKTLSPADLDKYAAKKEADFEREQCSCSYDPYGYGSYYGYGYGNGSYYGYGYGYGPNCYEVPFSAAVNATYRPGCDYSGVDWDHLNGSEIIKQIYTYTHDCIDALKDNFDKLNSSCLSNYTQTAEELKTLSPADLDKYAAKKEADFEREQCSCSYDPYGYGSYYGYGYGNGSYYGYGYGNGSGYGYGYGYGPNCYEVPFSAAVNATYRPGCDYSGVDWDHLNGSEIIKQIYTYTHDCIDALKDNFDKLNSSCLSNYTQTAEELKTLSPADLDKYAAKKEADFEREQCSCSYDPYGYGSYYGYGYGNGSGYGYGYGYGPNCYEVPFSAAVNATYRPGCDYSGVDWDHLNGSEIIKQIYTYTHDCIDALKDNFDKLNSSCLSNYTQTAEELKTLSPADLDKYAAKKEADFEREQCSCSYDPYGYGSYYGYGYGNGSYYGYGYGNGSGYGYGYGYGPNCYEVPFSAAVNATYRPGCDYSGVDWDHLNGSEIIKQIYTYTHDCIDALKDNFDKLNSSCLSNYTQTAEELKTLSPADLDKYAAKKEADFEREQCSCSYDPYGYGSYYGYGYGNGSGYGYGYGYGPNCYEVPFSAAVNATYRPGCDYSGVDWDHLNGSEIIKQIYTYTHDCIDALKDNFDKLNSSCLSNYTQTAEELKTLSPADLDKYAAKKEADFEREQCSCSYDPYGYGSYYGYGYGNGSYYGYGYGNGSGYGYGYGYGPNCYEVPFSAAVNATYRPGCDYSGVDWDHLNGSEIIKQIYTYTHDCIDALKDNFDKLNSSCLSNYTQTAEELKTLSPADLDKYAAKKEADFEREQCSCSYDPYGYTSSGFSPPAGTYPPTGFPTGGTGSFTGLPTGFPTGGTGSFTGWLTGSPSGRVPATGSSQAPIITSTAQPRRCTPAAKVCAHTTACPSCGGTTSTCWAFDPTTDELCAASIPGWTLRHQAAYDDWDRRRRNVTNNKIEIKAFASKCENLKVLLTAYAQLPDTVKDAFFNYVDGLIAGSDFEDIPVELLAMIETVHWSTALGGLTNEQKLMIASKLESVNSTFRCEMKEILMVGDFVTLYQAEVDGGTLDACDNDYINGRTCEKYLSFSCQEILTNAVDILKYAPTCLQKRYKCFTSLTLADIQNVEQDIARVCAKPECGEFNLDFVSYLYTSSATPLNCTTDLKDIVSSCKLDLSILSSCTYADLQTIQSSSLDSTQQEELRKLIADTQPADKSQLTGSQITEVIDVLTVSELESLDIDQLKTAVCSTSNSPLDRLDDGQIDEIQGMLEAAGKLDPTDPTDLSCLEDLEPGYGAETMDAATIRSKFTGGDFSGKTFDEKRATEIAAKIESTVTDASSLVAMSSVAKAFSSTTISSITGTLGDSEIKTLSTALSSTTVTKSKKKALIAKASTTSSGLVSLMESEVSKEIAVSKLSTVAISDLPFLEETSTATVSIEMTEKQATVLMEKVESASVSLTYSYVSRISSLCGAMSKTMLDSVSVTSSTEFYQTYSVIGNSKTINGERLSYITSKVESQLGVDGTDSVDVFGIAGNVLAGLETETLSSFSYAEDVVSQMSTADLGKWGIRRLKSRKLNTYVRSALNIASGTIDYTSASKLGNLLEILDASDFDRFDKDSIVYAVDKLKNAYLCSSIRKKIAEKYASLVLTGSAISSVNELNALGAFITDLSSSVLGTASSTILKDALATYATSIDARMTAYQERVANGYRMECEDDNSNDESDFKTSLKSTLGVFIDALLGTSVAGRRRRSTSTLTCAQMQQLGSAGLTAMTTAQISAMADNDFTSCASLLGGIHDWSSDQLSALSGVATRSTTWGSPSNWTTGIIQQAGVIAQALSTSDLQSMTWTVDDVSKMGEFSGWDDTKKVAIVSQWLSTQRSNDPSTITDSDLQSLGHMTCGLSTSQIQQITVYSAAADAVGEVTSCTELQMVEFANLAKTTYGSPVSSWSGSQVAMVGVHVGGLSKSDIATLTEAQIDNIAETHISYIPSTAFSGFTTTQINTFSTAQAQSTTSTQRSALSSSQLSALETVAGISWSSTGSGAGSVVTSLVTMAVCVVIQIGFLYHA